MNEINKLSLIRDFAEQIKKLPETVSSSFKNYLETKYDLDDLRQKAEHPEIPLHFGGADMPERKQLVY
jgi:hypothetical protein